MGVLGFLFVVGREGCSDLRGFLSVLLFVLILLFRGWRRCGLLLFDGLM